jgi:aminoglycoside phosphotransferase (APT) family kinase protein
MPPSPFEVEALAQQLCRSLGIDPRPVPTRDGREHHLFRVTTPPGICGPDDPGGERILKFPRADGLRDPFDPDRPSDARLRCEGEVLRRVRGVLVPTPYRVFDTHPVCAILGVIPGTTAEIAYERGQLDFEGLLSVCHQMGRSLATMHGVRRRDEPGTIPDLAGSDPATARLLHLDYHLGNVIGRRHLGSAWTVTGVVDWTCARWGPIEADLVEMQVSVFVMNPRARDAFVAGYRQIAGVAIDMVEVERRAALEIERRLVEDKPASEELTRRWADWVKKRRK